jgi:hypothetical protein
LQGLTEQEPHTGVRHGPDRRSMRVDAHSGDQPGVMGSSLPPLALLQPMSSRGVDPTLFAHSSASKRDPGHARAGHR